MLDKEKIKDLSFEETMKELEIIVKDLEDGELSLDESVNKYTLGLELSKHAYTLLENAKSKLEVVDDKEE